MHGTPPGCLGTIHLIASQWGKDPILAAVNTGVVHTELERIHRAAGISAVAAATRQGLCHAGRHRESPRRLSELPNDMKGR